MTVSALTARSPKALEKTQIATIQHIVRPAVELIAQKVPETQMILDLLDKNLSSWQELVVSSP